MTSPTGQLTIYDAIAEREATDAGIRKALEGASEAWKAAASGYVRRLAATGKEFTSEDALAMLEREQPHLFTSSNRAMGGIIRKLIGEKVIVATNSTTKSRRAGCHGSVKRVLIGAQAKAQLAA